MPRTRQTRVSKIKPWPNCRFDLHFERMRIGHEGQLLVYLERRSGSRFGRLLAMGAVLHYSRRSQPKPGDFFSTAKYRQAVWQEFDEVLVRAGVPAGQQAEFKAKISHQYPPPTKEELFLERLDDPFMTMTLGERKRELSYFRTGLPEFTQADIELTKACLKETTDRIKENIRQNPSAALEMARTVFGLGPIERHG